MNLLQADSYVDLLVANIQANEGVRGYQSKLARAARCHSSFFSNVLKGNRPLTLDQAALICDFWGLDDLEGCLFLLLVLQQRPHNEALQRRLTTLHQLIKDQLRERQPASPS